MKFKIIYFSNIFKDHSVITHKPTSVLSLPIKRKMEKIQLDPEVSMAEWDQDGRKKLK